jgi:hypothetical protein
MSIACKYPHGSSIRKRSLDALEWSKSVFFAALSGDLPGALIDDPESGMDFGDSMPVSTQGA